MLQNAQSFEDNDDSSSDYLDDDIERVDIDDQSQDN